MKRFAGMLAVFLSGVLLLAGCGGAPGNGSSSARPGSAILGTPEEPITVTLPSIDGDPKRLEVIELPNGRPVYAFLVSGYHQNRNFDMFHFYNFARCVLEKGGYVHYSWWNNLLAPYMERPLHDNTSEPGLTHLADGDFLGFLPIAPADKAIPSDDDQFQADAEAVLAAIREHNPQAAIVFVGHSMGGDAVARLGASTGVEIDLLAPIDPVGNRSCTPWTEGADVYQCQGLVQWTRFRATHEDWFLFPPRRVFGSNIKYLYHRWQQESVPPTDVLLPLPYPLDTEYTFVHPAVPRVLTIHENSTNVQSMIVTSRLDYPGTEFLSGLVDGHGEIVGFRGAYLDLSTGTIESHPYGLKAQGKWPGGLDPEKIRKRVEYLKAWERDPNYLHDAVYDPWKPDLCMVSGDLCEILRTAVNLQPAADAGPDQTVECGGPNGTSVTLDGSGSTDPDGDPLTYTWTGPFGTMTGETIHPVVPLGNHTITLTVEDGRGKTDTDTVEVTVIDSTPPSLSLSLSPDVLWPPNHQMESIVASIQVVDICDDSPSVMLRRIVSSEADNGLGDGDTDEDIQGAIFGTDDREFSLRAERAGNGSGRIYTITYGATDASGNVAEDATAEVAVVHDRGAVSR